MFLINFLSSIYNNLDGFFTEFPDSTKKSIDQFTLDSTSFCLSSSCPTSDSNSNKEDDDDSTLSGGDVMDIMFYIVLPILDVGIILYFVKMWYNKRRYSAALVNSQKELLIDPHDPQPHSLLDSSIQQAPHSSSRDEIA